MTLNARFNLKGDFRVTQLNVNLNYQRQNVANELSFWAYDVCTIFLRGPL